MPKREDVTLRFGADSSALDKTLKSIRRSVNKLSTSFGTLEGAMTAFATGSGVQNLIELNAQFEELRAGVEFAGGDFNELNKIAEDNAATIEDIAEAFTRLQNLRLDASRRSIEAYLNVAAGTPGKRLIDFTEAVADAVVGEFERLKEFGIRATKEGDAVAISFRGNTERIKNDAKEIEDALIAIGEVEFAGAQAARANTLSGAINNLSSAFDRLFISEEATKTTTEAIRDLTETLSDKDTIAGVNAFASAVIKSVQGLSMIVGAAGSVASDIKSAVASMTDFAGLSREELIEERAKLNQLQARAIINEKEISKRIEEGSFYLRGELKLQQDIIEQTENQINLISARLSLLKETRSEEEKILDVKRKQTSESGGQERSGGGGGPSAGPSKPRSEQDLLEPTVEQQRSALEAFRRGEITDMELARDMGFLSPDSILLRPGAYGTASNLQRPLPSTEGIIPRAVEQFDPMTGRLAYEFTQKMQEELDGRIFRVRVRPELVEGTDSDVMLTDENDRTGAQR